MHVSNVLGTINPVAELARAARKRGIPLLVDGSQAMPHMPVDVRALGCDFYALTGHKMFGPTGTGALWARKELLRDMPPFFGGGEMIREVRFDGTTYADPPHRFEAGTPNIAGFVGLGAAIDYIESIGRERIAAYGARSARVRDGGDEVGSGPAHLRRSPAQGRGDLVPDRRRARTRSGDAARSGGHCRALGPSLRASADAVLRRAGDLRASFAFYNTREEVDRFVAAIARVRKLLA